MFLRKSTTAALEQSLGTTIHELAKMDLETELSFVKAKSGKPPKFSKKIDHRIAVRGNHALGQKNIMTMDEVDKEIQGWKTDDRKY